LSYPSGLFLNTFDKLGYGNSCCLGQQDIFVLS
jgi:hypothetical protein